MGETLPREVIVKLLAVRDALAERDAAEAYHQLYGIACPDYDQLEPWAEWERIASLGPDAPPLLRLADAAPAPGAAAHQDALWEALTERADFWKRHAEQSRRIIAAQEDGPSRSHRLGFADAAEQFAEEIRAALNPEAR